MAEAIYLLCAAFSAICAFLLLRQHRASGVRLILWSGICFTGLALSNALLVVDLMVFPGMDLAAFRTAVGLVAMAALLYGFVWESC